MHCHKFTKFNQVCLIIRFINEKSCVKYLVEMQLYFVQSSLYRHINNLKNPNDDVTNWQSDGLYVIDTNRVKRNS